MKVALATVFFNPTIEDIKSFINLSTNFKHSLCYLNSVLCKDYIDLLRDNSIKIIGTGNNDGLSIAYNYMANESINEYKLEYIFLTDQDSRFNKKILEDFFNSAGQVFIKNSNIGICSMFPKEGNRNLKIYNLFKSNRIFKSTNFSINSGSLLQLKAWQKVGGYDEKLFIDKIDTDFCNSLKSRNFNIMQSMFHHFEHSIGKKKEFLFGFIQYNSQNKFRHFHSMYSRILILRKRKRDLKNNYLNKIFLNLKFMLQCFKHLLLILLFEDNKLIKVKKIIEPFDSKKFN